MDIDDREGERVGGGAAGICSSSNNCCQAQGGRTSLVVGKRGMDRGLGWVQRGPVEVPQYGTYKVVRTQVEIDAGKPTHWQVR